MKIKMWTVLLTTIRNARITQDVNHCQDEDHCQVVDHCQYHLGIDHCLDGNRYQDRDPSQKRNEHAHDMHRIITIIVIINLTTLAHEYVHDVE